MDNLPKENNNLNNTSGEIYNNQGLSGYQEMVAADLGSPAVVNDAQTSNVNEDPSFSSEGTPPAPPYMEDSSKKIIIYAIFGIIIALILFGLLIFIFRPKKSSQPANISLTYWGLWEDKELMEPVIQEYQNAHPNIKINYLKQDPKLYRERLQAAIERGEGPDIFRFHNTWLPMLINQVDIMPKTVYSDEEFTKVFYPVIKSDLKIGENYYGIPLSIDGLVLYYNEDILKNANLQVPKTWVDVQDAVSKLTVKESGRIVTSAIALGTAENIEHFSDILMLMMLQNGTQPSKSLFDCIQTSSNNCAIEALTFYHKFSELPNNTWDEMMDNSIISFAGGKVAMIIAPLWQVFTIKTMNENLNFKVAPIPQLPCEKQPCPAINLATYWIEGVSKASKNREASWEFLKYLSEETTLRKLYTLQMEQRKYFGNFYSRMEMAQTVSDNQYLQVLASEVPNMKSFYTASRTHDGESGINSTMIKYLKDAINSLSKGNSAENAIKTVNEGFSQVFSRFQIMPSSQ